MSWTLSVRLDDDKKDLIDQAVQRDRAADRSNWAREKLLEAAAPGKKIQPHPQRALALQRTRTIEHETSGCQHPEPARRQEPFRVVCGSCGAVVRRT